jgi:phosphoribosylamine--glycine ligase
MKILVVGGGCREHILTQRLKADDNTLLAVIKNRNPGIEALCDTVMLCDETNVDAVSVFAKRNGVDFAVIGPENPLAAGIVDALEDAGVSCFGPKRNAAEIESSKSFTRKLLEKHGIPGNPAYASFWSAGEALEHIEHCSYPVVVKPSGLTGGKGVKVVGCHLRDNHEAGTYVKEIFTSPSGKNGVVIEERLDGEEFSLQAISDGRHLLPFPLAQDHKRAFEGDNGPNTGGMGSYSMADGLLPFVEAADRDYALGIMQRVIDAMREEGREFRGLLYGGFMLTEDGVRLLEFNARFADPESMNILAVTRGDFAGVLHSAAEGNMKNDLTFEHASTVCRYYVPEGYGERPLANTEISLDEKCIRESGTLLYYGSVNASEGKVFTTTSRSFALLAKSGQPWEAASKVDSAGECVKGNIYSRKDIGTIEEIQRKRSSGRRLHSGHSGRGAANDG